MKQKNLNQNKDSHPSWHLIDAQQKPLGRVASLVSQLIRGKNKVEFIPYLNVGDHVVVINTDSIVLTRNKSLQKKYYRHSGYPGNLKTKTVSDLGLSQVLEEAIKGMLPANKLRPLWLKRLHLYRGSDHPHAANIASKKS